MRGGRGEAGRKKGAGGEVRKKSRQGKGCEEEIDKGRL
jgi:hypothetical protein